MSGLIQHGMGFGKVGNRQVPKLKSQAKRYQQFLRKKLLNSQKQSVFLEKFIRHQDYFKIVFSQNQTHSMFNFLYFIKINFQDCSMSGKIILKSNQMYKNIKTKKLNLLLLRYLLAMNRIYGNSYAFFINAQNGFIQSKFNFYVSNDFTSLITFLFQQVQVIKIMTKKFFYLILHSMNEIPQNFLQLLNKKLNLFSQQLQFQKDIYLMSYKHLTLSLVEIFGSQNKTNVCINKKFQKLQIYDNIRKNNKSRMEQSTKKLFHLNQKIQQNIRYQIDSKQYTNLKNNYLNLPSITVKLPQNPFIFNQIKLQSDHYKFMNINLQGGRNKIYVSQLQFSYIQSKLNKKNAALMQKMPNQCLVKTIAIKVPKLEPPSQIDELKIKHQVDIVKQLGCAKSIFFPRFYTCTQQKFKYKNHLLMDFLFKVPTLSKFLKNNQHSMSFISQINLMVNVMEALRVLKQHDIVHMDLSPNNILVQGNLLTKLIDFGESYHKHVPNHSSLQHGYTAPYVFPQRFRKKQFSSQSDTYSFGIILFQILFQTTPYSQSKRLLQSYKNENYYKRLYFSPESIYYSGYSQQISLVLQFIFKCLCKNQDQRPQRSWSIVFLKQIFYWYEEFYGLM